MKERDILLLAGLAFGGYFAYKYVSKTTGNILSGIANAPAQAIQGVLDIPASLLGTISETAGSITTPLVAAAGQAIQQGNATAAQVTNAIASGVSSAAAAASTAVNTITASNPLSNVATNLALISNPFSAPIGIASIASQAIGIAGKTLEETKPVTVSVGKNLYTPQIQPTTTVTIEELKNSTYSTKPPATATNTIYVASSQGGYTSISSSGATKSVPYVPNPATILKSVANSVASKPISTQASSQEGISYVNGMRTILPGYSYNAITGIVTKSKLK